MMVLMRWMRMVIRHRTGNILMVVRMGAVVRVAIVLENHPCQQQSPGERYTRPGPVHDGSSSGFKMIVACVKHKLAEKDQPNAQDIKDYQAVVFVAQPCRQESRHAQGYDREYQQNLDGLTEKRCHCRKEQQNKRGCQAVDHTQRRKEDAQFGKKVAHGNSGWQGVAGCCWNAFRMGL